MVHALRWGARVRVLALGVLSPSPAAAVGEFGCLRARRHFDQSTVRWPLSHPAWLSTTASAMEMLIRRRPCESASPARDAVVYAQRRYALATHARPLHGACALAVPVMRLSRQALSRVPKICACRRGFRLALRRIAAQGLQDRRLMRSPANGKPPVVLNSAGNSKLTTNRSLQRFDRRHSCAKANLDMEKGGLACEDNNTGPGSQIDLACNCRCRHAAAGGSGMAHETRAWFCARRNAKPRIILHAPGAFNIHAILISRRRLR